MTSAGDRRPAIAIAGGGAAALEALLTLHERLDGKAASLCLIAPEPAFVYRPLSSLAEFGTQPAHRLPLEEVAAASGARLVRDAVVLVDDREGTLLTRDGDWISFDQLLLAIGNREAAGGGDRLVWRGEGDPWLLRDLAQAIADGSARNLGVSIPAGAAWPLAGYELALILGSVAKTRGVGTTVSLLTEESRPLAPLGELANRAIAGELDRFGVDLQSAAQVGGPADAARFDRLVSLPANFGPGIDGLAADARGYLRVDSDGQVFGSERVWAAGDCTALGWKHSSLAVAQADAAADAIAAVAGAVVERQGFRPLLRGILVTDAAASWWAENMTRSGDHEPATHCLWWPPGKVLGGRLAHFVARRDRSARPHLLAHPPGIAITAALKLPGPTAPVPAPPALERDPEARKVDAFDRQLFAMHRIEREGRRTIGQLRRQLREEEAHSEEILDHLNAAGYLRKQ